MRALALCAAVVFFSLPASVLASDGHEEAAAVAVHKEHLRHFSLWNMVVPSQEEEKLRGEIAATTGMDKSFYEGADFVKSGRLAHVGWALVAFLIVLLLAFRARQRLDRDPDAGVLPERKYGPLLLFEVFIGAAWDLMRRMMPEREARRYFPIIGTLAIYIFVMNVLALLPFGTPATDNLNTNIGMGLTIFFATHYAGIRAQGLKHYAKHFMGPVLALAPLMVVLEIVGHVVRPFSLSLRLMGNMTGDHNVLFEFMYFKIPLIPLPVMFLGLLVVVVQTIVFVMLSTVYLSLAVDTSGADEGH